MGCLCKFSWIKLTTIMRAFVPRIGTREADGYIGKHICRKEQEGMVGGEHTAKKNKAEVSRCAIPRIPVVI